MITFHHANTRGSRAGRLRIAHLCVVEQASSTRHVSFLAALDTDHKHKFSLTYLSYLSDSLTNTHNTFGTRPMCTWRSSTADWRINTNPISHRLWAQSHRDWGPRAEKNWAWQESWDRSVSHTGFSRETSSKILSPKICMDLAKLVPRCLTSSHRGIPMMIQRRALQSRILKTEN